MYYFFLVFILLLVTLNLSTSAVDISVGDIIGIFDIESVEGFYTVKSIVGDNVTVSYDEAVDDVASTKGYITRFTKVRASDVDQANKIAQKTIKLYQKE